MHHFSLFFGRQGLHVAKLLIVSTDVPVKLVFLLYPMDLFLKSEELYLNCSCVLDSQRRLPDMMEAQWWRNATPVL